MRHPSLFLAGILALPACVGASETWSWTTGNFMVARTARWQASIITVGRTGHGLTTVRHERIGSMVKFRLAARFSGVGGYYFYREYTDAGRWTTTHRAFAGIEAPIYSVRGWEADGRVVLERYLPDFRTDYHRLRWRARISTTRRFGPYAYIEPFAVHRGIDTVRYTGGLRWMATRECTLEAGYLYDARKPWNGPPRHVIDTHVYFDRFRLFGR